MKDIRGQCRCDSKVVGLARISSRNEVGVMQRYVLVFSLGVSGTL